MNDKPIVTQAAWADTHLDTMGWHDNAAHAGESSAAVVAGQALA